MYILNRVCYVQIRELNTHRYHGKSGDNDDGGWFKDGHKIRLIIMPMVMIKICNDRVKFVHLSLHSLFPSEEGGREGVNKNIS